jgi:hypothetical protein
VRRPRKIARPRVWRVPQLMWRRGRCLDHYWAVGFGLRTVAAPTKRRARCLSWPDWLGQKPLTKGIPIV